MKRRILILALFLLLGAVVNVAVAWGCAMTIDVSGRNSNGILVLRSIYPDHSRKVGALLLRRWSKPGAVRIMLFYGRIRPGSGIGVSGQPENLVPNWAQDQLMPWKNDSSYYPEEIRLQRLVRHQVDARGWPMYSVWCVWGGLVDPTEGGIRLPDRWTSQHDRKSMDPTTLPLRPIWPGFAINTIFYAAILWLLTLGPFTARRVIRSKQGRCIKCSYDLRGTEHDVCPECGIKIIAVTRNRLIHERMVDHDA